MIENAKVILWGKQIGAVSWIADRQVGVFQYDPDFLEMGIQVSPLMMPLREIPYDFPYLKKETFKGLPGLLADSLPDRYGNAVINAWLAQQGRNPSSFTPVERLCYTGIRGMGALEYKPSIAERVTKTSKIDIEKLVELSNQIISQRANLSGAFNGDDDTKTMKNILRVGTSAGGARAKAILAWNPTTNEFRSGQLEAPAGFEYWIMKFDGVSSADYEISNPRGYGKIEYAYSLMAAKAGIEMTQCRLHHEAGRSHFMTRRFDRDANGGKIHMQTLCAIAHVDYNDPNLYSYEEALQTMLRLGLPQEDLDQMVLRAMFNVVGRNQDDHVKNVSFLMNRSGVWRLSPAYDVTYAYNPNSQWVRNHQMSVNGKRDLISKDDLVALAGVANIKRGRALEMLEKVVRAVMEWPEIAHREDVAVDENNILPIMNTHQTDILV